MWCSVHKIFLHCSLGFLSQWICSRWKMKMFTNTRSSHKQKHSLTHSLIHSHQCAVLLLLLLIWQRIIIVCQFPWHHVSLFEFNFIKIQIIKNRWYMHSVNRIRLNCSFRSTLLQNGYDCASFHPSSAFCSMMKSALFFKPETSYNPINDHWVLIPFLWNLRLCIRECVYMCMCRKIPVTADSTHRHLSI